MMEERAFNRKREVNLFNYTQPLERSANQGV